MDLSGKVAFVTGGDRGIGKAICLELINCNASVFLTYRERKDLAENLVSELKSINANIQACKMDVTDRPAVRYAMRKCFERFSGIDVLVNNAGINLPTDFPDIMDGDWDNIMNVNLKGPFICMQEVIPFLRKNKSGSIINIGSVSGQYGGPRTAHYAASKAGLISLSQVVARYLAKYNIRCNTIAGGFVSSEMADKGMNSLMVGKIAESILLQRLGNASEIASVVSFLASDASSYITAQTINVNGGLYF